MKFAKIIGTSTNPETPKLIRECEEKLSAVYAELSLSYDNKSLSQFGGDPLVFNLCYTMPHICDLTAIQLDELEEKDESLKKELQAKLDEGETLSDDEKDSDEVRKFRQSMRGQVLRTAATNGRVMYFNPKFLADKSKAGIRFLLCHESTHCFFEHPDRRGMRDPRLFNIAADFKVNNLVMEDLKARDIKDFVKMFTENLGDFIYLKEYADFLKNPFEPPARLAHLNPMHSLKKMVDPAFQHPGDDHPPMYFAEPELSDELKRPENIYDYLLSQIPKCPKCGKMGMYKKPEEYKKLQKKLEEQDKKKAKEREEKKEAKQKEKQNGSQKGDSQDPASQMKGKGQPGNEPSDEHSHGENGEPCDHEHDGQCSHGKGQGNEQGQGEANNDCFGDQCDTCGNGDSEYVDVLGAGDLLDSHIDADISQDEMAKKMTDAIESARKMAGRVSAGLEDELGMLTAPKVRWEDFVRNVIRRKKTGQGKNDYTLPKKRPLFAGLYTPQKKTYDMKILAAYDCSGSMSQEDIALGISQLQVLKHDATIYLLPFDTIPYYDKMVKIDKADKENLMKGKVCGRGGTLANETINSYENEIGKVDLLLIITDSFLADTELRDCRLSKGTNCLWLVTSHNTNFKPPFGKVMHLRNETLSGK